ncbi:MAG: helix-turn-helix domain-containing protein [Archaeoglobales archaeon]|nr:helix-turn-helix domain-containing protein [Archaeoglobales archaeon]
MPEKPYTTGEVAKTFGVSYATVKGWAYSGKIKYIKTPGGKYRYPESEIKRLIPILFRWISRLNTSIPKICPLGDPAVRLNYNTFL